MAMGPRVNLLTAAELDAYSAHLSAIETTTWSSRWTDCTLQVASFLTWLEDYIKGDLEPAIPSSQRAHPHQYALELRDILDSLHAHRTEFVVNKTSPPKPVEHVVSPASTERSPSVTRDSYVKGFTDISSAHPSWTKKWTVLVNPEIPPLIVSKSAILIREVYTSFLLMHGVIELLFPLSKGRIWRAQKLGELCRVDVVLDPRQYGTNVRQLRVMGDVPDFRQAQRKIFEKLADLDVQLWAPNAINPPIPPSFSIPS
ncbi:unnamed protein product [Allacma fusca]|uniref:Uncharacterized protein n=1 Tax=Allacma fusca TaxID=39272 RepID=A0A8J2JII3_9HEXA|nr:unnamed protein product [Allacma fusca]